MANTYTLIASSTVGSGGAANIEFTSIPATYTDLLVKISGRDDRAAALNDILINFNSSTSNLTDKRVYGNGSVTASDTGSTGRIGVGNSSTSTTSTFSNFVIYIPNYTSSNNKLYSADAVSENNATTSFAVLTAGLWSDSSAITSIKIIPGNSASFVQYSTAYLYGISNS